MEHEEVDAPLPCFPPSISIIAQPGFYAPPPSDRLEKGKGRGDMYHDQEAGSGGAVCSFSGALCLGQFEEEADFLNTKQNCYTSTAMVFSQHDFAQNKSLKNAKIV